MRCLRKRIACQYSSSKEMHQGTTNEARRPSTELQDVQTTSTAPAGTTAILPSLEGSFVLRMFEAYFQHIHPIPAYSYLHKASLVHRFEAGHLDRALIKALIGTTCELLHLGAKLRDKCADWMSQAKLAVMKELGRPSVIRTQVLVLLVKHHMRQGRLSNAFMLHAIASRAAFALGLNYEAPRLGFLARESRRRLMWSLFFINTRLAGGMSDFALCSASWLRIQLPCHERNSVFDLGQDTEALEPTIQAPLSDTVRSLAIYMRLMWFRHRILQTAKEAVLNRATNTEQLTSSIETLRNELLSFETSLPPSLKFSSKSLQLWAYSTRLGPYLLIHVWLCQCYCDLYRVALTGLKEALPSARLGQIDPVIIEDWRRQCFDDAMALSKIFSHFAALKNGCPVVEHDVIACAYQCARLLLHRVRHYGNMLQTDRFVVQASAAQCLAAIQAMPSRSSMGDTIVSTSPTLLIDSDARTDPRLDKTASKTVINPTGYLHGRRRQCE